MSWSDSIQLTVYELLRTNQKYNSLYERNNY